MVWPATLTEPCVVESFGITGSADFVSSFGGVSLPASCATAKQKDATSRSRRQEPTGGTIDFSIGDGCPLRGIHSADTLSLDVDILSGARPQSPAERRLPFPFVDRDHR